MTKWIDVVIALLLTLLLVGGYANTSGSAADRSDFVLTVAATSFFWLFAFRAWLGFTKRP